MENIEILQEIEEARKKRNKENLAAIRDVLQQIFISTCQIAACIGFISCIFQNNWTIESVGSFLALFCIAIISQLNNIYKKLDRKTSRSGV